MSDLTYGGTSGWSGTDTSQERAESQDGDGTTGKVQRLVLGSVHAQRERGMTIAELRSHFQGRHHGSLSSALTNLHRAGKIARLSEKRGRCKVYVTPQHVMGRETEQPTRQRRADPDGPQVEVTPTASGGWLVSISTDDAGADPIIVEVDGLCFYNA